MDNTWKSTAKRYIAFFDYLGFGNYVMRNTHSAVLKRMEKMHKSMDYLNIMALSEMVAFGGSDRGIISNYNSKSTMFSDSFVIFTENDSRDNLIHLIMQAQEFFSSCLIDNIPVKGAISHGTITADFEKNIFFGKALVDAYQLESELQMYGVVLDSKTEKQLLKFKDDKLEITKEYKVPFKGGRTNHLMVNWVLSATTSIEYQKELKKNLNKLKLLSDGINRRYFDNTIDFLNEMSN